MVQIHSDSNVKLIPNFDRSYVRETLRAKKSSSDLIISVADNPEESIIYRFFMRVGDFFLGVKKFILRIWYYFKSCCCPDAPYRIPKLDLDVLFTDNEIEKMREGYWGLGKDNMWEIIIDEEFHDKGRLVFDEGLHGRSVEPGFIVSMEEHVFPLISEYLGTRTTTEFILEVHKAATWHFRGDYTDTLSHNDEGGTFRDSHHTISCRVSERKGITDEDWEELLNLDPPLVTVAYTSQKKDCRRISYISKTSREVHNLVTDFLDDFYEEIREAKVRRDYIRACGRLAKKMDSGHITHDGCGRTTISILQKHLTEYVGHPAIIEDPIMFTIMGIEKLCDYLEEALQKWEDRRDAIEST